MQNATLMLVPALLRRNVVMGSPRPSTTPLGFLLAFLVVPLIFGKGHRRFSSRDPRRGSPPQGIFPGDPPRGFPPRACPQGISQRSLLGDKPGWISHTHIQTHTHTHARTHTHTHTHTHTDVHPSHTNPSLGILGDPSGFLPFGYRGGSSRYSLGMFWVFFGDLLGSGGSFGGSPRGTPLPIPQGDPPGDPKARAPRVDPPAPEALFLLWRS